jgi:hypothetical protein
LALQLLYANVEICELLFVPWYNCSSPVTEGTDSSIKVNSRSKTLSDILVREDRTKKNWCQEKMWFGTFFCYSCFLIHHLCFVSVFTKPQYIVPNSNFFAAWQIHLQNCCSVIRNQWLLFCSLVVPIMQECTRKEYYFSCIYSFLLVD